MRVMLLNGRLSDRGGADRWLLGVLARLQGRVETLLAVGYQDRQLPREEKERLGRWIRLKGLDSRGLGQRGLQGSLSRLQQVLDDFEPHVVHVNDVTDPDLLRLVAASGRGVMTVQDHRFFCPGQGKVDSDGEPCLEPMDDDRCLGCLHDPRYGHKMLELTRQRLDALAGMRRITVLSRYMASELAAAAPDLAPIEVLPPFVDGLEEPDECRVVSKRHHLLAGRLSVHKGLEVALRAAGMLRGLPLVVAGDGPLTDLVQQAAARDGSGVRFVDWADRARLEELMSGACSLWLPSLWGEPFGIVGIEALSRGVPVIAARVGGVEDWLTHKRHGLLVTPGSAMELCRAADRLAGDPHLARELGRRGRRRVARDFDAGALMDRLVRLYQEVAGPGFVVD